jgi:hypothetical protein
LVKVLIKGRVTYPVTTTDIPLAVVLVLDPPTARSGQCGEALFPGPRPAPSCAFNSAATALKCR